MIQVPARVPILLRQSSRSHSKLRFAPSVRFAPEPPGIFDAEDLKIVVAAYAEACAFFADRLTPAQRRNVALAILLHARRGLLDRRRLAIKGIVAV